MTYNQIKSNETLLKDVTGIPWIVGYVDDIEAGTTIATTPASSYDFEVNDITEWEYSQYYDLAHAFKPRGRIPFNFKYRKYNSTYSDQIWYTLENGGYTYANETSVSFQPSAILAEGVDTDDKKLKAYGTEMSNRITNELINHLADENGISSNKQTSVVLTLDGKKVYDNASNSIFEIHVQKRSVGTIDDPNAEALEVVKISDTSAHYSDLKDILNDNTYVGLWFDDEVTNHTTYFYHYYKEVYIITRTECEEQPTISVSFEGTEKKLNDAPYKMFCMPFATKYLGSAFTPMHLDNDKELCLAIVTEMIRQLEGHIYDVQILPYCPVVKQDPIDYLYYYVSLDPIVEGVDYNLIKDSNNQAKGVIMWADASKFSFTINESITIKNVKIESECDIYRLCSPNYASIFEFNAAKNNGVDYFIVDCAYKPYQPYIHIAPNFNLLYGTDYGDARGLICSGDFSITRIADAWETYELNNKNYQLMFNREIENMQVTNKIANVNAIVGAIAGTGAGVASGITGGAMVGGPVGAVVGGIAGGVTSAVGGIADIGHQRVLQAETLDYKKDMFGMQLDNIKALPNTLTKVSALNQNNKIFPVLEYYTCTDKEKEALRNKLYYNGMTVGRIGTIKEFMLADRSYIKGHIIRYADGLAGLDTHMANTIAEEIYKGVYI